MAKTKIDWCDFILTKWAYYPLNRGKRRPLRASYGHSFLEKEVEIGKSRR